MEKTITKKCITLQMANAVMDAAEKKAKEKGILVSIAIVDEGGTLKALRRMDNAPLHSPAIAQSKAYSSVAYGLPTMEWYPMMEKDPPLLAGAPFFPGLCTMGGGWPLKIGKDVIGGIGVSGAHWHDDDECANAGVDVLGK